MHKPTFNPLSWSVSRGQDTYGYNICRLDSGATGHRFRTCGGGYDMIGTVLGDLLGNEYESDLLALYETRKDEAVDCGYSVPGYTRIGDLYGMTRNPAGKIRLDGACGRECMVTIGKAIGLDIRGSYNKKGHCNGFFISRMESK